MKNDMTFDIVMVDDDPEDVFTVRRALQGSDLNGEFTAVSSGAELFELLEMSGKPKPDAIFLDINMPRMNGLAVLEHLKTARQWSDIPVIMLTTSDNEFDQIASKQVGAADFVTKRASMKETQAWISSVKYLLEDHQRLNSNAQPAERERSSGTG